MAFHHHMGTIVETDEEVDKMMRYTGEAVGLLYDTGHSSFRRRRSARSGQAHVKRIVHVHCKDPRKAMLEQGPRAKT